MNQLNASVRSIFHDLVEQRLWPVALALVIALIAIPVLLSNSPAETPAPGPAPATPATGAGALPAFEPVVNTEGSKSSEIRKNLTGFDSKDPFKVQGLPSGGSNSAAGGAASSAAGGGDSGTTLTGSGTSAGSGTGTGTSGSGSSGSQGTSGSGTQSGGIKFYTWTATVRFGVGDNPDKKRLERFRALPNSENPVVVFMGVTTKGDQAVFMVSAASGTTGEGDCEPDDTCTFLYMEEGQTQTFEAVDENDKVVTYTLKLISTNFEETEPPSTSSSSSRAKTRAERRARRAERIRRDRRDEGFSARIEAVGF